MTARYDAKLGGYVPAIPEPFWYSGWRTLFRYRPACYRCGKPMLFKTRREWETHYVLRHLESDERDARAALPPETAEGGQKR